MKKCIENVDKCMRLVILYKHKVNALSNEGVLEMKEKYESVITNLLLSNAVLVILVIWIIF